LGITEQPVVDANGKRGMKVETVYPGTPAQQAGLKVGDVIQSVNGYMTETPGNLAWIIANATPDNVLKLNVRSASDGKVHLIAANLP
jgi:S1-C subfamily serine protease